MSSSSTYVAIDGIIAAVALFEYFRTRQILDKDYMHSQPDSCKYSGYNGLGKKHARLMANITTKPGPSLCHYIVCMLLRVTLVNA